jgi:uncharacterized protein YecE (DUF72 family)
VFYPEKLPQAKWFDFYCTKLDSLELNSSFYSFPTEKRLSQWYEKSPDDFIITVKAPRLITHYKRLNDCERLLDDFYQACSLGLKEKAGCLLFQMPPTFSYSEQNLELVIKSMRPGYDNVVEFRQPEWWSDEVIKKLAANDIHFCSVSHPTLPSNIITAGDTAYIRMHGNRRLFCSGYSMEELQKLKSEVQKLKGINKVYIYFNNTADTEGILNALDMKDLLTNEVQ